MRRTSAPANPHTAHIGRQQRRSNRHLHGVIRAGNADQDHPSFPRSCSNSRSEVVAQRKGSSGTSSSQAESAEVNLDLAVTDVTAGTSLVGERLLHAVTEEPARFEGGRYEDQHRLTGQTYPRRRQCQLSLPEMRGRRCSGSEATNSGLISLPGHSRSIGGV